MTRVEGNNEGSRQHAVYEQVNKMQFSESVSLYFRSGVSKYLNVVLEHQVFVGKIAGENRIHLWFGIVLSVWGTF